MSKYKYKIYNGKSLKKFFENSRIFVLISMFIIGLTAGASMLNNNSSITERLSVIIESYSELRAEQGILINFCNSLTVNVLFSVVNLFLAFSLVGYPLIIALPTFKGLALGAVSGYLYSTYKLIGLGYCMLMIFPGAVSSTFAFLLACNDSCEYSKNAFMKAIKGRGQFEKDETRVYLTRQLVFLGICAVSSGIDAVFCEIFSRFFEI